VELGRNWAGVGAVQCSRKEENFPACSRLEIGGDEAERGCMRGAWRIDCWNLLWEESWKERG
jgi:hypothetical protein